MKSSSVLTKILAASLSALLFFSNSVFAHATQTNLWSQRRLAPKPVSTAAPFDALLPPPAAVAASPSENSRQTADFEFPLPNGTVRKVLRPQRGASKRIVLHIQDVHMNGEAQANIEKTLSRLIAENRINLIALEGAFGTMDLSAFRSYPYQDALRCALAGAGDSISGPLRALLSAPGARAVTALGVDDRVHYARNVEAYVSAARETAQRKRELAKHRAAVEQELQRISNAALKKFHSAVVAYRSGDIGLAEYAQALPLDDTYPMLAVFRRAARMEKTLDFGRVERERAEILEKLLAQLDGPSAAAFKARALALRDGRMRPGDFYANMKQLCLSHGCNPANFSVLAKYWDYVALAERIDPEQLFRELLDCEQTAYARLAVSNDEKTLTRAARHFFLTAKLLDFSLSRAEWEEYKRQKLVNGNWKLDQGIIHFENFYREAEIRDVRMAENFLSAINTSSIQFPISNFQFPSLSVLITGGFHSSGIDQRLVDAGCTVISFTPNISKIDTANGSAYLSVFARQRTPLEKLFEGQALFLAPPQEDGLKAAVAPILVESLRLHPHASENTLLHALLPRLSASSFAFITRLKRWSLVLIRIGPRIYFSLQKPATIATASQEFFGSLQFPRVTSAAIEYSDTLDFTRRIVKRHPTLKKWAVRLSGAEQFPENQQIERVGQRLVSFWYELLPAGFKIWKSSLAPWFVFTHPNRNRAGHLLWGTVALRLSGHALMLGFPCWLLAPLFTESWGIAESAVQIGGALSAHMELHFIFTLLFPRAALTTGDSYIPKKQPNPNQKIFKENTPVKHAKFGEGVVSRFLVTPEDSSEQKMVVVFPSYHRKKDRVFTLSQAQEELTLKAPAATAAKKPAPKSNGALDRLRRHSMYELLLDKFKDGKVNRTIEHAHLPFHVGDVVVSGKRGPGTVTATPYNFNGILHSVMVRHGDKTETYELARAVKEFRLEKPKIPFTELLIDLRHQSRLSALNVAAELGLTKQSYLDKERRGDVTRRERWTLARMCERANLISFELTCMALELPPLEQTLKAISEETDLAVRMREMRALFGADEQELARALETDVIAYSAMEKGKVPISLRQRALLATHFETTYTFSHTPMLRMFNVRTRDDVLNDLFKRADLNKLVTADILEALENYSGLDEARMAEAARLSVDDYRRWRRERIDPSSVVPINNIVLEFERSMGFTHDLKRRLQRVFLLAHGPMDPAAILESIRAKNLSFPDMMRILREKSGLSTFVAAKRLNLDGYFYVNMEAKKASQLKRLPDDIIERSVSLYGRPEHGFDVVALEAILTEGLQRTNVEIAQTSHSRRGNSETLQGILDDSPDLHISQIDGPKTSTSNDGLGGAPLLGLIGLLFFPALAQTAPLSISPPGKPTAGVAHASARDDRIGYGLGRSYVDQRLFSTRKLSRRGDPVLKMPVLSSLWFALTGRRELTFKWKGVERRIELEPGRGATENALRLVASPVVQVLFYCLVPLVAAVPLPALMGVIVSAAVFAAAHPDRRAELLAIGVAIGLPFLVPGFSFWEAALWSAYVHFVYNSVVWLFRWAGKKHRLSAAIGHALPFASGQTRLSPYHSVINVLGFALKQPTGLSINIVKDPDDETREAIILYDNRHNPIATIQFALLIIAKTRTLTIFDQQVEATVANQNILPTLLSYLSVVYEAQRIDLDRSTDDGDGQKTWDTLKNLNVVYKTSEDPFFSGQVNLDQARGVVRDKRHFPSPHYKDTGGGPKRQGGLSQIELFHNHLDEVNKITENILFLIYRADLESDQWWEQFLGLALTLARRAHTLMKTTEHTPALNVFSDKVHALTAAIQAMETVVKVRPKENEELENIKNQADSIVEEIKKLQDFKKRKGSPARVIPAAEAALDGLLELGADPLPANAVRALAKKFAAHGFASSYAPQDSEDLLTGMLLALHVNKQAPTQGGINNANRTIVGLDRKINRAELVSLLLQTGMKKRVDVIVDNAEVAVHTKPICAALSRLLGIQISLVANSGPLFSIHHKLLVSGLQARLSFERQTTTLILPRSWIEPGQRPAPDSTLLELETLLAPLTTAQSGALYKLVKAVLSAA